MTQQEPEEGQAKEVEPGVAEIEDIETLKKILTEEKGKVESYLANWQRTQADFINYKRRSEQEKEEIGKFANAMLLLNLLPILDDLERAFTSIPPHLIKLSWVDGIKLIERKLWASLEAQGLSQIKALGEPFDPKLHEAAMHANGKEGIVIEELQKGYKLHDRVIRPAMVVVGNGEEEEKKED
ncbi:MAG: nucleotide exchange factor GrpE [Dehalococcoidia bacterium]|nr:nucleotide exchange factor GrpE [Dehalococcoidia bacterium]MBL7125010.1 nucleotide exchange factor GrpE [Dehalococcoidales bacterium]